MRAASSLDQGAGAVRWLKWRLLFHSGPGPLYDLEELGVGAQRQGLFIRVPDRNNGREGFSRLVNDDRTFSGFCGVFRKRS